MKRIGCLILTLILLFSVTACGKKADKVKLEDKNSNSNISLGDNDDDVNQSGNKREQLIADGLGLGAVISFGTYEQDNDLNNGKEPVEWIVLDVQEDRMLLLSKKVLDAAEFDESDEVVYWDESSIRSWLNQTFLNDAFSMEEQKAVLSSQVTTPANEAYDISALPNTEDKVFFLSIEEVEQYFKIAWGESGHFYDNDIKAEPTEYALSKGLETKNQKSNWYLRSMGSYGLNACACVTATGHISTLRNREIDKIKGIRPAVWVSLDGDYELIQEKASNTDAGIETTFPTDWEGRYVLVEQENSVSVYCKKAYESADKDKGLLFSVYYITDELVLPDYTSIGTYNGYPVEAVVPWEIPSFSSDDITEEFTDMIYDVSGILDMLIDRIAELEHFRQIELYGYDLSLYTTPDASAFATGVYALDCGEWSEESKRELLGEYNHTSYLSVSPDGTAYLSLGSHEPIKGTVLAAANSDVLPEDEPQCIIWFEDGKVIPGYYLQLTLTIIGMEEVKLNEDAPKGRNGSMWTYTWVTDEFWTEQSMQDGIG